VSYECPYASHEGRWGSTSLCERLFVPPVPEIPTLSTTLIMLISVVYTNYEL
jgi:hypothetical protein